MSVNEIRRVVVTGATGLLGGSVVGELLARGIDVVAIVRSEDHARRALGDHDGIHLVVGDVLDTNAWAPALRGADAIIHTAAYFREYYQPGFDPLVLERTNVGAVAKLVAAAEQANVQVFVHISSAGIIGPTPRGETADEDTAPNEWSRRNHYYASKVRAERLVTTLRDKHKVRIPVVVPGWMWGPGDAAPTPSGQMFLSIANAAAPGVPKVKAHIVDARDVAHACVQAAQGMLNRRYLVAGQRHDLPSIAAQIARLCGVPAPRPVSPRLALAASGPLQLADRLRGRPPLVTTRATRVLIDAAPQQLSSARAQTELGITFRLITETLSDEAHWFRRRRLIPAQPVDATLARFHTAIEDAQ